MNVPDEIKTAFEAELRVPLEDTRQLRKTVASWAQVATDDAADHGAGWDTELAGRMAETLETLLKRVSRKTTPLHHRLLHTTGRWCTRDVPRDGTRQAQDLVVLNEAIRVVRKPQLHVRA